MKQVQSNFIENHTSAWVFSSNFAKYVQNTFS